MVRPLLTVSSLQTAPLFLPLGQRAPEVTPDGGSRKEHLLLEDSLGVPESWPWQALERAAPGSVEEL